MVAGVPIFSVIYAAIRSVVNTRLQKKIMTQETVKYMDLEYIDSDGKYYKEQKINEIDKNVTIKSEKGSKE